MKHKVLYILLVLGLMLAACSPQATPTEAPAAPQSAEPTAAPAEPTAAPAR